MSVSQFEVELELVVYWDLSAELIKNDILTDKIVTYFNHEN